MFSKYLAMEHIRMQPAPGALIFDNEYVKGCPVSTFQDESSAAALLCSCISGDAEFTALSKKKDRTSYQLTKIDKLHKWHPTCTCYSKEFRNLWCIQHCDFKNPGSLEFAKTKQGWECAIPHAVCGKNGYFRVDIVFALPAELMVAALLDAGCEPPKGLYAEAVSAVTGLDLPENLGGLARLCVRSLLPEVPALNMNNDFVFANY
jgi:hypothetical protein